MARRTFSFDGVMAARARLEDKAQQRNQQSAPQKPQPQARPAATPSGEQAQVVDLAAFRAMHPGVIGYSGDQQ